ncbi:putative nucleic-acid-binding protein containing a Zn-ribbon [Pseudomonas sp. GM21]|uniref:Zn-ribbon domain-containing OB-fold protein n=1 Tax=Pseudomonas sp. GM21 TaxID=1144325 RepID=UPI000272530D|nr:OB-fold domain-containing protein [Pseudomonas sp. GM21]EJM24318.1 putative nucleic-acid-binding protein containing a Zn-ribbon [Pseudomonas sp. GM21]
MSERMTDNFPPQPSPSLDSLPFWESLKKGVLAIQRCTACKQWSFPMMERCRHCAGELTMEALSGDGTIYTYIVEHQKVAPGFDDLRPYPIALVTPKEAPHVRLPARIIGDKSIIKIGAAVRAEIADLPAGDFKVACFRLV